MFITNPFAGKQEGFGEQYKIIIFYMIFAELNNLTFVYSPFKEVAHNYDNDPGFLIKLENLINFKNNIPNYDPNIHDLKNYSITDVHHFIHKNIEQFEETKSLQIIKNMFYEKNSNPFKVNFQKNIAIHIRRPNADDPLSHSGLHVPNEIYFEIIKNINAFTKEDKIFHIFSQGNVEDFQIFDTLGVKIQLHINESLVETFLHMVFSDILVVSPSALSYTAGILSKNQIYYINHCNPLLPSWNVVQNYDSPRMYHKLTCILPPFCVYFDSKTGEYIIKKDMIPIYPLKII